MNKLRKAVEDYIDMRRSLGYKLHQPAVLVPDFISFLEQKGASYITIPLAPEWSERNRSARPAEWARRLTIVRCVARARRASDPRPAVPPSGLRPDAPRRSPPSIYSA